jgi:hypothetical protein
MLADGHVPAVIDWPPYFRPAGMANAIAATDAVTFRCPVVGGCFLVGAGDRIVTPCLLRGLLRARP